jgi:hypothetical protein
MPSSSGSLLVLDQAPRKLASVTALCADFLTA